MSNTIGFDNEKYLREQTEAIRERVKKFDNKLYLEFGGKLLFDYHAARVLPGYDPNVKMRLLQQLKDDAEIILCIYAGHIEKKKVRADFGITYDVDALKLIGDVKDWGINISGVVITRYDSQPSAKIFKDKLERQGIRVYTHPFTKGYPTSVDTIVSDEGYGANQYIETTKNLVIVTAPGPGSGKLATCLSQLYHEHKKGLKSGYAKFETFPIWSLPLKHPANIAYEAATADIRDFNMIDPFHLEAYKETAVNYNRDVECFPVIKRILDKITGQSMYLSPTDMGVNRAGFGIVDDAVVQTAARQEAIRRYFRYNCEYMMGLVDKETVQRAELIMDEMGVKPFDRRVVEAARLSAEEAKTRRGKGNDGFFCGAALELHDGTLITGKNSRMMHAATAVVFNAIKYLGGIPDKLHLLSPMIIDSVRTLKQKILGARTTSLDLDEALIALTISSMTNTTSQEALEMLAQLRGCEVHMTHIPTPGDEAGLKRLGVNLTTDTNFASGTFYGVH